MSLMTFSIVGLICITCSALILSNNRISDLEYKNEKLKEENLGLIELIKSNTLEEVSYIVENTKTEEAFYNYLKDQKIEIELEPSVKKFIAGKGIDKNFGARPLRRTIQSVLEDRLAEEILDGNLKKNKVNKIGVKDDKVIVEKK